MEVGRKMNDILKDVALELSEGTKLGKNGLYPTHKEVADTGKSSTLKEDKLVLSDAEKTAREITEVIHFGGAVE